MSDRAFILLFAAAIALGLIWNYAGEPWQTVAGGVGFFGLIMTVPRMVGDAIDEDCRRIVRQCTWELEREVDSLRGRVAWLEQQRERDRGHV